MQVDAVDEGGGEGGGEEEGEGGEEDGWLVGVSVGVWVLDWGRWGLERLRGVVGMLFVDVYFAPFFFFALGCTDFRLGETFETILCVKERKREKESNTYWQELPTMELRDERAVEARSLSNRRRRRQRC